MISPDFKKYSSPDKPWTGIWSAPMALSKEEADALSKLAEALLREVDTEQKENQ